MTNWWPLWNHSETTLGPLRDHSCLAIANMETTLWSHGYQIGISWASLCRIYGHFQLSLLGWEVINSQINQYIRLIRKKFRILNFIFWCVGQFLEQIFCRLTGEALSVGGLQLPARNWSDTVWDLSYHRNNNFFSHFLCFLCVKRRHILHTINGLFALAEIFSDTKTIE